MGVDGSFYHTVGMSTNAGEVKSAMFFDVITPTVFHDDSVHVL